MYNKILLLTLLFFTSSITSYAQRGPSQDRREKLEQRKIAYLSTELEMTTDQAQRFWPIYNKYEVLNKESRENRRADKKDMSELTDAEAEKHISMMFQEEERKLQWKKDYVKELDGVLDNKQILKLINAEKKFRKEILEKYKKRRKRGMKRKDKDKETEKSK